MRQIQWALRPDGVWEFNALPYLLAEVQMMGSSQTNMLYDHVFKITIIGANTIETMHTCANAKKARSYANAIMLDWAQTTTYILARPHMAKPPIS